MVIKWIGAHPTNFRVGRGKWKPELIVIHVMGGSLFGTDAFFNTVRPDQESSAHYGVSETEVHQYVKELDQAFHAGLKPQQILDKASASLVRERYKVNPNLYSIGIEHDVANDKTDLTPWSDRLYHQSARLVAEIAKRWSIPLDRDHVVGHRECGALKACPGACDLNHLVAEAKNASVS